MLEVLNCSGLGACRNNRSREERMNGLAEEENRNTELW
jgi:hypothetical protein